MSLKHGTISLDGKQYDYEVFFEHGEYRTYVDNCREACRTTGYEPEERHIRTWIYQANPNLIEAAGDEKK